jgi:glutamate dehydrogenase
MDLNRQLLASPLPEDPYFAQELARYFPPALQQKFGKEIGQHRLQREIIVTATTNSIINRMGPSFALRAAQESSADVVDVARAYSVAREAFDAREAWAQLEQLDGQVPSPVQYQLYGNIARGLRHATMWMLQHHGTTLASGKLRVIDAVERYAPGIRQLRKSLPNLLTGALAQRYTIEQDSLIAAGISLTQARMLAAFPVLEWTLDVIDLAVTRRISLDQAARRWFALPVELQFDWIEDGIDELPVESTLHATARRQLRGEVKRARRDLVDADLSGKTPTEKQREAWQQVLRDIQAAGQPDHAVLSVCVDAMRELLPP